MWDSSSGRRDAASRRSRGICGRRRWEQRRPADGAVLDGFPEEVSIKDIAALLSAVGFASPPAWLRPYQVLSTGQQFRASLARLLATGLQGRASGTPLVFDEYTSVVDRTVAQLGSAALAKAVRQRGLQFVAVTCHEDVEAWLQPDWVYRPAEQTFTWRCLQRRPSIELGLVRCQSSAWPLFAAHHYLSAALSPAAVCFLASWGARPVAFSAWLPFFGGGPPARREHRTVTLPDYQGVGIGAAVSAAVAGLWKALGFRATSTTTHPGLIQARLRSPHWRLTRAPGLAGRGDVIKHARTRLTAGFEYIGPALPPLQAQALLAS
jgi:GNAT superfamily N-acetyltransferase